MCDCYLGTRNGDAVSSWCWRDREIALVAAKKAKQDSLAQSERDYQNKVAEGQQALEQVLKQLAGAARIGCCVQAEAEAKERSDEAIVAHRQQFEAKLKVRPNKYTSSEAQCCGWQLAQYRALERKRAVEAKKKTELASAQGRLETAEERIRGAAIGAFEEADRNEELKAEEAKQQRDEARKGAQEAYARQDDRLETEKSNAFKLTQANYIADMQHAIQAKVIEVHQLDPNL